MVEHMVIFQGLYISVKLQVCLQSFNNIYHFSICDSVCTIYERVYLDVCSGFFTYATQLCKYFFHLNVEFLHQKFVLKCYFRNVKLSEFHCIVSY